MVILIYVRHSLNGPQPRFNHDNMFTFMVICVPNFVIWRTKLHTFIYEIKINPLHQYDSIYEITVIRKTIIMKR